MELSPLRGNGAAPEHWVRYLKELSKPLPYLPHPEDLQRMDTEQPPKTSDRSHRATTVIAFQDIEAVQAGRPGTLSREAGGQAIQVASHGKRIMLRIMS